MSKIYPKIIALKDYMEEWDYDANNAENLDPSQISSHGTIKVFWKCKTCGFKWQSSPYYRVQRGSGCLQCAKKIGAEKKHKTALRESGPLSDPLLLQDWDAEANYPKTAKDFTPNSNEKAFWKCHVCGYQWQAKINNRTHGRGCPACSHKIVVPGINDLTTTHPNLAKEWHPSKNGNLTPSGVTYGQGIKIWWLCPQGHEYQASLLHRSSGTNCPICNSGRQTSFAEQAVYFYVKKIYPDAISRYTADFLGRMELDIYIPSIKYAIEYDGIAWHGRDKITREKRKYALCKANGIKLIRLKENPKWIPFSETSDMSFLHENLYEEKNLDNAIRWLISKIDFKHFGGCHQDVNLERDRINILESFKQKEKSESLSETYPEIAKEWHPSLNGKLTPSSFKPKSEIKVWWLCPKCQNAYKTTPSHRVSGTGCPQCGIKKSAAAKSKKVAMVDCNTGDIIRFFESISSAAREMKLNSSNLTMVCKGVRPKAGGYNWKYYDKNDDVCPPQYKENKNFSK